MLWDIFCKVIDNHGDIGVCWRLSAELARRGERVRLWADEPSALAWMAPAGHAGVEVMRWTADSAPTVVGDVVIEAFGCELDAKVVSAIAARTLATGRQPEWINLEYLSAEAHAARNHGLTSPVFAGPGRGLSKRFFYPGFAAATGGLLREQGLAERRAAFDRTAWLHGLGIGLPPADPSDGTARLIGLFCYEPPALGALLQQLAQGPQEARLLVTAGRAAAAVNAVISSKNGLQPLWNMRGMLSISYLPHLTQLDFDHLLWACDLNFVRGEDSLVRALWAGKPFVWQLYPQEDDAHHVKLAAFLDWLQAPASVRSFHLAWNGIGTDDGLDLRFGLAEWTACIAQAKLRLHAQPELVTRLIESCAARPL